MRLPLWARLVLLLVAVKLAATLLGLLHQGAIPNRLDLAFILGFGIASLLLFVIGSEDPRATSLGGFFLVLAAAFCRNSLKAFSSPGQGVWHDLASVADSLKVDGFLPFFLWTFVRNFPEAPVPRRLKRLLGHGISVSAWAGFALFAGYLVAGLAAHGNQGVHRLLGALYGLLIIPPPLPPPPILVYKARLIRPEEGRRARLFALSLAVAVTPS